MDLDDLELRNQLQEELDESEVRDFIEFAISYIRASKEYIGHLEEYADFKVEPFPTPYEYDVLIDEVDTARTELRKINEQWQIQIKD